MRNKDQDRVAIRNFLKDLIGTSTHPKFANCTTALAMELGEATDDASIDSFIDSVDHDQFLIDGEDIVFHLETRTIEQKPVIMLFSGYGGRNVDFLQAAREFAKNYSNEIEIIIPLG